MERTIEYVAAERHQLWDAGFRPVAVLTGDKRPIGNEWPAKARLDPPEAVSFLPVSHALNSGLLCDGLRAIDLDIDDADVAAQCRAVAVEMFGETSIRTRRNSPRCLLLYRAAVDAPAKVTISGSMGKVEVLGRGQQFVAFGTHPSGADLEWFPDAPGQEPVESVPAVSETGILDYLRRVAPIIGADPPRAGNGHDTTHVNGEPQADPLRVAAALAAIPNQGPPDWEYWNRVGMAVWRATGGSSAGWEAWNAWSARHASYDPAAARARWDHYATSPPTAIGAGTIFHIARETRDKQDADRNPGLSEPPPEPQGDYWERLQDDARETQFPPDKPDKPDKSRKSRFRDNHHTESYPELSLTYFNDIQPNLNAADFVENLLIEGGMSVLYGESNSGKTFFATDLAMHVATGVPWCNREVEISGVIYCALEGAHGIANRLSAYRIYHQIAPELFVPLAVIPVSINLLDPNAHTEQLIKLIKDAARYMSVPLRLVIVDTLARAIAGGNENASEDMGALIINTDRIRLATKAHVLFVHHTGKDMAKGARGHSSLVAATDTEIEVSADDGNRLARVTKQRELECQGEFAFQLHVVSLGQNHRGKEVTSCIVRHGTPEDAIRQRRPHLVGHTKRAFDILTNLMAASGKMGFADTPANVPSVPDEWWRDRFYEQAMPAANQDTKQRAFRRAADILVERQAVGMAGGRVWISHE